MLIIINFLVGFWLLILDYRVHELSLFGVWFVIHFLCSLIWYVILSRYYFSKKYWLAFWTMLLVIASTLISAVFSSQQTNEITLDQYYTSLLVSTFIAIHGIALLISQKREREVLKAIGVFYGCFGLGMVLLTLWMFHSLTAFGDGYGLKVAQWSPIILNFALILFIINFVRERIHAEIVKSKLQRSLGMLIVGFFAIGTIAIFLLTFKTGKAISQILSHAEPATDYEQKLAQRFEEKVFSSKNNKLPYRFLQPIDYDSTKKYPLVVCLHGSSGRGVGNVKQVSRSLMATILSTQENRKKYPAFLFVPQCPPNAEWGGLGHLPEYNPLIIQAIDSLEKEYSIDTTRRYLTGYSMGGYGTWHLIGTRPAMFAAAVPMCGAGDPNLAKHMVEVPIWAFHGAKDRNVLVRGSRDVVKAIKDAGGDPLYTEYKDKAHNIWENISKEPDLLPWLFSQVKN